MNTSSSVSAIRRTLLAGLITLVAGGAGSGALAQGTTLPQLIIAGDAGAQTTAWDGSVQARLQTVVASQVAGAIVQVSVAAGDRVRAGQPLVQIDARSAEQTAAASDAQVAAARAALDVAARDLARKRELHARQYISEAALQQAQAAQRAAQAEFNASREQAAAARTQTSFHQVTAPYDGIVASVAVERGSMAMPGSPLLVLYDPAALRVTAAIPATVLQRAALDRLTVELAAGAAPLAPQQVQVLPTVDPATLTQELRANLPAGTAAAPGQFARVHLPDTATGATPRIHIPVSALVRRGEVTAAYVLGADGRPQLRQLRLGPTRGDRVEVLAGLDIGEILITDPRAATRAVAGQP